jgi:anti-anti-sigma factor
MHFMKEESGQAGTLHLAGELDIRNASELKEVLREAQDAVERLALNLEGVTGVDVSALQLLCSVHRRAMKSDKHLTVIGNAAAPFRRALRDAGYEREQGCPSDRDQTCLWRKR